MRHFVWKAKDTAIAPYQKAYAIDTPTVHHAKPDRTKIRDKY
ncbi:hypothetical protein [Moraxella lacunata]|nr:hypothetical protein [Moraxella lacunata]